MEQAEAQNRTHFSPYSVTREYKLLDRENGPSVVAEITVLPPDSKKYTIEETNGSGWGEKIVRKMLGSELAFAKNPGASDIRPDNYDFMFVREDEMEGQRCYVCLGSAGNGEVTFCPTLWLGWPHVAADIFEATANVRTRASYRALAGREISNR